MTIITNIDGLKCKCTVESGDFQLSWSRINLWIRKAVKKNTDTTSCSNLRVNETRQPLLFLRESFKG